ncbi:MAG: hypothetical protein JWP63_3876 [Candidatus Solibacter sp.]|nr:hypothetical protein [Candidatus Solibacter sp.]
MKKSAKVTLTVVAAMGLASCGRSRRDPCDQSYFNEMACQDAVRGGGYYYGGSWYPMMYHYPYPYYYDHYRTYVRGGGRIYSSPSGVYARPSGGGATSSPGVQRGGFGSTGAGHSSGGGE